MRRTVLLIAALLLSTIMAQQVTLLSEDFDSPWTPANPPPGWRISDTTPGFDAWHRVPAGSNPWSANTTPYAGIWYQNPGANVDTLFAPPLDCSIYRNIVLRCSTLFRPYQPQPYIAQVIASTDGGSTWWTVRDYYNETFGPGLEVIPIDAQGLHSDVRIAWVWSGDLAYISYWCLDNVSVTAATVHDTDIAVKQIRSPRSRELPGELDLQAVFENRGLQPQLAIPVLCDIYKADGTFLTQRIGVPIPYLAPGDTVLVTFPPPYLFEEETTYVCKFYHSAHGDQDRTNDTAQVRFRPSLIDYVYYDNDTAIAYERWPRGGNSGWGLRITPLRRARIVASEFRLRVPSNNARRYRVRILDSDGAGGAPGSLIFESPVLFATQGWNIDSLDALQLTVSRPFYLFYIQERNSPQCPELARDSGRSPEAEYWNLDDGNYYPDTDAPNSDWMIRCVLDYRTFGAPAIDARAVFVYEPESTVVPRPLGMTVTPKGRIENHGTMPLSNIPVVCTIYTAGVTPTPVYSSERLIAGPLHQDEGEMVEFDAWRPIPGPMLVHIRTNYPGDEDPSNDVVQKAVFIYRPVYAYGPDDPDPVRNRYFWVDSDTLPGVVGPVYEWIDTTRASNVITSDAEVVQGVFLPFNFKYRGNTYDRCWISNNGWLSFDQQFSSYPDNGPIPSPASPNNALYVFWDKLRAGALPNQGSRVVYKTDSIMPHRRFTVIWHNMRFTDAAPDTQLVSFEVTLYETSNLIKFQYKDVEGALSSNNYGASATVGIENSDGQIGLQYLYGDSGETGLYPQNKLLNGRAILFYQDRRDVGVAAIVNPSPVSPYIAPVPIQPQARIQNYGTTIQPFYAHCWIYNAAGTSIYHDSALISVLPVAADTVITFAVWTASFGTYTLKCSTDLVADADSSNNARSLVFSAQAWIQKASIPQGIYNRRVKAGALTTDGHYIYALKGSNTNEFWYYDIDKDSWDTLPAVPYGPRNKRTKDGCALAYGDGYVYCVKGNNTREFYAYNTLTHTWEARESIPWSPYGGSKGCRNGTNLVYTPNALYLLRGNNTPDFERYRTDLRAWDSFPRDPDTFQYGIAPGLRPVKIKRGAVLIYQPNDTVMWLALGGNSYAFLKYNIRLDTWLRRPNVPAGPRNRKVKAGAAGAALYDTVYILKGGNTQEFWAFNTRDDTSVNAWHSRSPIPLGPSLKKMKGGGAMTAADFLYTLKGANGVEFWLYGPGYDTGSFRIASGGGYAAQEKVPAGRLTFALQPAPNPASRPAHILLTLPQATRARMLIYDIAGKLIAEPYNGILAAGHHDLTWDGRDFTGQQAASGIYVLRFESPDYQATRKLILKN